MMTLFNNEMWPLKTRSSVELYGVAGYVHDYLLRASVLIPKQVAVFGGSVDAFDWTKDSTAIAQYDANCDLVCHLLRSGGWRCITGAQAYRHCRIADRIGHFKQTHGFLACIMVLVHWVKVAADDEVSDIGHRRLSPPNNGFWSSPLPKL